MAAVLVSTTGVAADEALSDVGGTTSGALFDAVPGAVLEAAFHDDLLRLQWKPVGAAEAYLVVDEHAGEVVWRGTETNYAVDAAGPTSRSLLVYVDRGGEDAELLGKALAMNPGSDSDLAPAVAVSTATNTDVSWDARVDVASWTLEAAANDFAAQALALDGSATRTELPLVLGQIEQLTITGDTVLDGHPTRLIHGFDMTTSQPSVDGDAAPGDVTAAGVAPITTTRVPYETFIPMAYVDAPDTGSFADCESGDGSDYWYGGDGRGVAYESGKYRTRGLATYYWSGSTLTTKVVAPTKRYRKTSSGYSYESERRASSASFVMNPVFNNGRSALTQVNHSVTNPYCSAMNAIDYDIRQEVHQTGGHYFLGRHDRMPDHQLYRSDQRADGSISVSRVFHHELVDPTCLNWANAFCPMYNYQYSK